MKITSILGNSQKLDGGAMFGNAPRPMWSRWIEPDDLGRIPLACRCFLIEAHGKKILLETGIGAFFAPDLAKRYGIQNFDQHLLIKNLKAADTSPDDIDYVILSHLHFDHAGGMLPEYGSPLSELYFKNATVVTSQVAYDRALAPHPRDRASFIPELMEKLKARDSVKLLKHGDKISELPGFDFILTEGHTPGQLHTLFQGKESKVFFCGDLIPGKAWVHLPITMGYDRFAEKVIDEKTEYLKRAVDEKWIMLFTHDPAIAGGTLSKEKKYIVDEEFKNFNSSNF